MMHSGRRKEPARCKPRHAERSRRDAPTLLAKHKVLAPFPRTGEGWGEGWGEGGSARRHTQTKPTVWSSTRARKRSRWCDPNRCAQPAPALPRPVSPQAGEGDNRRDMGGLVLDRATVTRTPAGPTYAPPTVAGNRFPSASICSGPVPEKRSSAVDHRRDEQRDDLREQQATHHRRRAAGAVRPGAQAERQRQRAHHRGEGGHHDGPVAQQAGPADRVRGGHALLALRRQREVDHHDRVLLTMPISISTPMVAISDSSTEQEQRQQAPTAAEGRPARMVSGWM